MPGYHTWILWYHTLEGFFSGRCIVFSLIYSVKTYHTKGITKLITQFLALKIWKSNLETNWKTFCEVSWKLNEVPWKTRMSNKAMLA